ncbi:methyl-accepting chemotaxis protein [Photobacterium minamisatsumaniensis]|uniref:methyl-accepting chemotaxis protein n=1 Tax=Photobacterium minamisatsumaniensis TaxID=2910233 RepID=UPI003D0C486C
MRLGFKARINLSVAALVACSLFVLGAINIHSLKTYMVDSLTQTTMSTLYSQASEIETWVKDEISAIDHSAKLFSADLSQQENINLVTLLAASSNLNNAAIAYDDGRTYAAHGGDNGVFPVSEQFKQRPWYIQAKQQRQVILTDIYTDSVTNNPVISIAAPVYENGQFVGVLLGDLQLGEITQKVNEFRFAGGAATLVDNNFIFIASDDPTDIGKTPSQVSSDFIELEQSFKSRSNGNLLIPYLGTQMHGYFTRINLSNDVSWTLMIFVDEDTALTSVNEMVSDSIMLILVLILVSVIAIIMIMRHLYRPLIELKGAVQDLGKGSGDLTRRLTVHSNDDLGQISHGFNDFVSNLQHMMLKVVDSSTLISSNIEQLSTNAKQNESQLLTHSHETEQVVTAISQMSETAISVAENIVQSTQITQAANAEADQSKAVVHNAVSSVSSLVDEVDAMSERIQVMNQDANQINATLSVIGDIAEQTNLLALNAAIEAARAGEQGRGFAVVADEVRALAARTQQSTSEINEMLAKLLQGTNNVVTAMNNTKERCQSAANTTSEVSETLDQMGLSVNQIEQLSTQISTAAEEQSVVSNEVNQNMLTIRDIVNTLVQSGQETVKATDSVAKANQGLLSLVTQFKLK